MSVARIILGLITQQTVAVLAPSDRLESWKQIAAHLNRSERTVRRWAENEGLPVHRLQHDARDSVYVYTWEMDAWRESRWTLTGPEPEEATTSRAIDRRRHLWLAAAIVAALAAALGGFWLVQRRPATAVSRAHGAAVSSSRYPASP